MGPDTDPHGFEVLSGKIHSRNPLQNEGLMSSERERRLNVAHLYNVSCSLWF